MNLFERFWKTVDATREARESGAPDFELSFTAIHPPDGETEAARDLATVARRAPKRYPPMVLTQPAFSSRPFCLVYTVGGLQLPEFHQLFEEYVDKNAFMAETFLRLRPHYALPYLLFIGDRSFFLYDAMSEELLRWGVDFAPLDELLFQPLHSSLHVEKAWDEIPRKSFDQKCDEFARWLDLWKAQIGARTTATPQFMQNLMQKVLLLFMFDVGFGFPEQDLQLRTNFLEQRESSTIGKRRAPGERPSTPFDGVAWFYEGATYLADTLGLEFLRWTQAESAFFALMGADARQQFSLFALELFLLSQSKFQTQVQAHVFSDPEARLKLWKFSVTETVNIKRRLQADDINVYEPIWIDLDESGVGWALHVIDEALQFWRERCSYFARELAEHKSLQVQFDMFQQPDLAHARVPMPQNLFETTFTTSIRISYDFPLSRATLEYLVVLRAFEFCRQWSLPLQPLGSIAELFVRKERIHSVQEM